MYNEVAPSNFKHFVNGNISVSKKMFHKHELVPEDDGDITTILNDDYYQTICLNRLLFDFLSFLLETKSPNYFSFKKLRNNF